MEPTLTAANASTTVLSPGGINIFSVVGQLFETSGVSTWTSFDSIIRFFDITWSIYALLAYLFSIGLLVLYVYASSRFNQLQDLQAEVIADREKIYDERYRSRVKNNRLEDVLSHITTDNPNDWKLAIIEADIILDDALKSAGYAGTSLGERLRSVSPTQLQSLDDAWQAHKVRNQVAHAGADFILTRRLAEDTIKQYRRVFNELGIT